MHIVLYDCVLFPPVSLAAVRVYQSYCITYLTFKLWLNFRFQFSYDFYQLDSEYHSTCIFALVYHLFETILKSRSSLNRGKFSQKINEWNSNSMHTAHPAQ